MRLIPISEHPDHAKILWDLLAERPASANISHRQMPTWEEHLAFIKRMAPSEGGFSEWRLGEPRYQGWYLIRGPDLVNDQDDAMRADGPIVGSIYLTRANEIGIFVFKRYWGGLLGRHAGPEAVKRLMEKYGPARYLANIAPTNEPSRKMFEKLGFKLIQVTYALEAE